MANEIDSLEVKISSQAEEAFSKLDQLVTKLDTIASSLGKISSNRAIKGLGDSVGTASTKVNNFVPKLEKLQELFEKFNEQGTLEIKVTGVSEEMLANLVNFTEKLKDIKNTIRQIDRAGALSGTSKGIDKATQKAQEFEANVRNIDNTKINVEVPAETAENVNKAANSFNKMNKEAAQAKLIENVGKALGKVVNPALKVFGAGVKTALKPVSAFTKGIASLGPSLGNLGKSLERTYKMLRLMIVRSALRAMITNTEQGFKNLTQYSDQFNASVSMLWNSLRQLGNAFAAASSPMINAFAPALDWLIQKIISAINAINQLISALLGNSTWIKATHLADKYGAAVGGAAGSAEKLNKQLQGFDELNNLTSNNGGGGGGGGGAGTNASDMFTTEQIDSYWKNLSDKIKQTWETTADFTWLGKDIGERINDALVHIDTEILPGMKNFAIKLGKALGTAITGFVEVKDLGYNIGKTLADAIDVAVSGINSFFANVRWRSVGKFLGDGINGIIDSGLIQDVAQTILHLINSGIETFTGFATTVQWKKLGDAIGDGIANILKHIDIKSLGEGVNSLANGLLDALIHAVDKIPFGEVGQKIADFINSIEWGKVVIKLGYLALQIGSGIAEAITELWSNGDIAAKIGLAIVGLISVAKLSGVASKITGLIASAIGAEGAAVAPISFALPIALTLGFFTIAGKAFRSESVQSAAADVKEAIENGANFKEIFKQVGQLMEYEVRATIKTILMIDDEHIQIDFLDGNEEKIKKVSEGIKNLKNNSDKANGSLKNLSDTLKSKFGGTLEKLKGIIDKIISVFQRLFGTTEETKDNVTSDFDTMNTNASNSMDNLANNAAAAALGMKTDVNRDVNNMTDNIKTKTESAKTKALEHTNALSTTGKEHFKTFKDKALEHLGKIQTDGPPILDKFRASGSAKITDFKKSADGSFQSVYNSAKNNADNMNKDIPPVYKKLSDNGAPILTKMNGDISKSFTDMYTNSTAEVGKTNTAISTGFNTVSAAVSAALGGVPGTVEGKMNDSTAKVKAQDWTSPGSNLVAGLRNGIGNAWGGTGSGLIGYIIGLARGLTSALMAAFRIGSPSKVWRNEIGVWLPAGLEAGIEDGEGSLLNTVGDLGEKVNKAMADTEFLNPFSDMGDINGNVNVNYAANSQDLANSMATAMATTMNSSQQQQNDLLREQNSLLTQILEKDTGIRADDLFNSVRRSNRAYFNQTGDNALVY